MSAEQTEDGWTDGNKAEDCTTRSSQRAHHFLLLTASGLSLYLMSSNVRETDLQQRSSDPRQRGDLSQACSNPTLPPWGPVSVPPSFLGLGVYFSTFSGAICDQACSCQPLFLHLQLGLRA